MKLRATMSVVVIAVCANASANWFEGFDNHNERNLNNSTSGKVHKSRNFKINVSTDFNPDKPFVKTSSIAYIDSTTHLGKPTQAKITDTRSSLYYNTTDDSIASTNNISEKEKVDADGWIDYRVSFTDNHPDNFGSRQSLAEKAYKKGFKAGFNKGRNKSAIESTGNAWVHAAQTDEYPEPAEIKQNSEYVPTDFNPYSSSGSSHTNTVYPSNLK